MRAEHGRVGVFKTPLHKTITIEHLEIRCHEYSRSPGDPGDQHGAMEGNTRQAGHQMPDVEGLTQSNPSAVTDGASLQRLVAETAYAIESQIREGFDGVRIESPLLIDINNATKVTIRNLHFCLFRDRHLDLGVQCSHATSSASDSRVVLRGAVVIQGADDSRLVSGHVLWDIERNHFTIPGAYILVRDGIPTRGYGTHCDYRLRLSDAHEIYGRKGMRTWVKGVSL